MSRIEKTLEKAVEIREKIKEEPAGDTPPLLRDRARGEVHFEGGLVNPDDVDEHIICVKDSCSAVTEQYKKLRARVIKATEEKHLNTIMITSPDVGEGKTITAINLAVAIAREIDHTVLLVDADLKRPSVHKYLGLAPEYGLTDYLAGRKELSDILIKTGLGKLVFLPAGKSPQNTAEVLSSDRMKNLIQELKRRYRDRYVIFDTSPLLVASDALPLSDVMDGVILVIQATRTTPETAARALSLLNGANILGAVFNAVPEYLAKNLYPYYHFYGEQKYFNNAPAAQ